jgi:NADP-reducing hydrogenase subunit HndB
MKQIKSLAELIKIRDGYYASSTGSGKNGISDDKIQVRVHMGTSGIASGAKAIYDFFIVDLEKRNIDALVIKTGDMGYCFAEPTIEVSLPGAEPVVFGNVDTFRADEIIEKYIKTGEYVEGVLPVNYQKIS